jgi:hypothetical protein
MKLSSDESSIGGLTAELTSDTSVKLRNPTTRKSPVDELFKINFTIVKEKRA